MVRFGLLGPLMIVDRGGRQLDPGGPRPRRLLAMLLAACGRIVADQHADRGVCPRRVGEFPGGPG